MSGAAGSQSAGGEGGQRMFLCCALECCVGSVSMKGKGIAITIPFRYKSLIGEFIN